MQLPKVFTDDPAMAGALETAFRDLDVTFVAAELIHEPNERRMDRHGLDVALEEAKCGATVIVYGLDKAEHLADDSRFVALQGMPYVGYIVAPFRLEAVRVLYQELKAGHKRVDALAVVLYELERLEQMIGSLKHDHWRVAREPERLQEWIIKARAAGFSGTDQEVEAAVLAYKRKTAGRLTGQVFDGVFVDIQGTLVKADGSLNAAIHDRVSALERDKPITVWTGGELSDARRMLKRLGITWKLANKFDFRGAEVEVAFDDLPQHQFKAEYGIKVRNYIQV